MSERRGPATRVRLSRRAATAAATMLTLVLLTAGCQPGAAGLQAGEPSPSMTPAGTEPTSRPDPPRTTVDADLIDSADPGGPAEPDADPSADPTTRPATPAAGGDTCHQVGDFDVCGQIYTRYAQLGGTTGALGRPVDDATRAGVGSTQRFENGTIATSPSTGTHVVTEPAADAWADRGGADGPLGYPLLDPRPAAGADSVSYFQGGAVYVTGEDTDTHESPGGEVPAVDVPSVYGLPLADFVVVRDARAAGPAGGELVWTTDGCSGPTPPEVDALFAGPCLRHDFGYRNFLNGPKVDPTQQRRLAIDNQFLTDLRATCGSAGEPQVIWFGVKVTCQRAAQLMYDAVRAFG
ncbi:phospholipase A2 [Frankia sp. R43]|uniref:phospholipase A2 n=1 Tax=Frankia sp. R43 TaxID=269536 RepID=UPI0006C9FBF0|nr:phospholipase A2 [Frankia sp. R43]KPM52280.1 phospholipase A2 [Frankia sp. R43]